MNATHFHLLLNHFPIIGTLLSTIIIIYGFITKDLKIKLLSSYLTLTLTLIAIPVYLSGEPAEEQVEGITGISESSIELHEDAAAFAMILMVITGITALSTMVITKVKPHLAKRAYLMLLLCCILSFTGMARAGYLGGKIRHTELTSNNQQHAPQQHEAEEED